MLTLRSNDSSDRRRISLAPLERAVDLVDEIGVCVQADDIDRPVRLHPATERIADRVIAADRDRDRASLDDPSCHLADPGEVPRVVGTLDRDVAEIGHRDADEILAVAPDSRSGERVERSIGGTSTARRWLPSPGVDRQVSQPALLRCQAG
jgi:hypothetical protein